MDAGDRPETEVWDLCRPEGVRGAQAFRSRRRRDLAASHVALALQEAVNCSSQARQTPLHAAAEAGDACMVRVRTPSSLQGLIVTLLPIRAGLAVACLHGGPALSQRPQLSGRLLASAWLICFIVAHSCQASKLGIEQLDIYGIV